MHEMVIKAIERSESGTRVAQRIPNSILHTVLKFSARSKVIRIISTLLDSNKLTT